MALVTALKNMLKKIYSTLLKVYPFRITLLLGVMFVATVMEGISITAILPLLGTFSEITSSEGERISLIFQEAFHWVGVELSLVSLLVFVTLALLIKSMLIFYAFGIVCRLIDLELLNT